MMCEDTVMLSLINKHIINSYVIRYAHGEIVKSVWEKECRLGYVIFFLVIILVMFFVCLCNVCE